MPSVFSPRTAEMNPMMQNKMRHFRRGVTLMEVIFAIGVVLTGLLGLAALIPIAAGNARATLEMDQSISESTSAAAAGVARGFMNLDSLVIYDKPSIGSSYLTSSPTNMDYAYLPTHHPQTLRWKTDQQTNYDPPLNASSPVPRFVLGKLESPGYGHHQLASGLTAGICIDPNGMPAPSLLSYDPTYDTSPPPTIGGFPSPSATGNNNAFDHSRFPYYSERYNPLNPPNEIVTAATAAPEWPMSPRMWRATIASNLQNNPFDPVRPREIMPQSATRRIFTGFGGIDSIDGLASDDPRGLLVSRTRLGGSYVDVGRSDSSEYTWFATLAPPIDGGKLFRQSIVVVRQRLAPVPLQAKDPLALDDQTYTVTEPDENQNSERLTWVGQAIGFSGGAGGEVLLYGSHATIADVVPDEWVMLSSQPHTFPTPAPPGGLAVPTGPAVHRWFRVTNVAEPQYGRINGTGPNRLGETNWVGTSTPQAWRRWVTLAGPDWSFGFGDPTHTSIPNSPTLANDTFCTIVSGAVSVYQSEVQLN